MSDVWRIELFGRLRARRSSLEISRFRSQKCGALFAFLAFYSDRPHPRETLIELLWPSCVVTNGRNNLRVALSSLRHQLEPPGTPSGSVLLTHQDQVQLNPAFCITDVFEFNTLFKEAQVAITALERERYLNQAANLYQGPLLPGHYDDWAISEGRRLTERYLQLMRTLLLLEEQRGATSRAIELAQQAIRVEAPREEFHRDLMRLHANAGNFALAFKQFHQLKRVLKKELGLEPSRETRTLAAELQRRHLEYRDTRPVTPPSSSHPLGLFPIALVPPAGGVATLVLFTFSANPRTGDSERFMARGGDAWLARPAAGIEVEDPIESEIQGHSGRWVYSSQDTRVVAFGRAIDALRCALSLRQRLASLKAEERGSELSVRMALYTEELEADTESCWNRALQRGLALLSAGHAGQVLCSEATAVLLKPGLISDVTLVELGTYDLAGPTIIFQIDRQGDRPCAFAPLKVLALPTGQLPRRVTRFFGREKELELLRMLVLVTQTPLITLFGPAGTGKSRLALEFAIRSQSSLPGSIWYISMAAAAANEDPLESILAEMGLTRMGHIDVLSQLASVFFRRRGVLILDNFEHLVSVGAARISALLAAAPGLTCLITSRVLLSIAGEQGLELLPLTVPDSGRHIELETLAGQVCVQLFVDRAQAAHPSFQLTLHNALAVAELCRRLEGIPLAIELAAARSLVLSPEQLLERLGCRLDSLVNRDRNADCRHRTLRAAIDWSFQLLEPVLKTFFAALSVFRGGWTLEAAAAIGGQGIAEELLERLRSSSLIFVEETGGPLRYRMLELFREYAAEQLDPHLLLELQGRHLSYFLEFAERTSAELFGPRQALGMALLSADTDNLRGALSYALTSQDAVRCLRLVATLSDYWSKKGTFEEATRWLEQGLALGRAVPPAVRGQAIRGIGSCAVHQGDYEKGDALLEESAVLLVDSGTDVELFNIKQFQAFAATQGPHLDRAEILVREVFEIGNRLEHQRWVPLYTNLLAMVALRRGDPRTAIYHLEQSITEVRETRSTYLPMLLGNLGATLTWTGDYHRAKVVIDEAIQLSLKQGATRFYVGSRYELANLKCLKGNYDEAREIFVEVMDECHRSGYWLGLFSCIGGLARLAALDGQGHRAICLDAAYSKLHQSSGFRPFPAEVQFHKRCLEQAWKALPAAEARRAQSRGQTVKLEALLELAREV